MHFKYELIYSKTLVKLKMWSTELDFNERRCAKKNRDMLNQLTLLGEIGIALNR